MDVIFKVLLALITGIFVVFTGISVTFGFTDAQAAENYFQDVSEVVVESNYNDTVIEQCIQEAALNDYVLSVAVEGSSVPGEVKYAKIELKYKFKLKLIGVEFDKSVSKVI